MSEFVENKEDLQGTAEMLEQILEVMPDDLFTLRALYETYLKLEAPDKAFQALTRLDDQTRSVQNGDMIRFILGQYESVVEDMPEVRKRMDRLYELQLVADMIEEEPPEPAMPQVGRSTAIDAEMALAWDLLQDEQLSQDEYSNVLHDLTEMSSKEMAVPVTVLHVLHDRNFSRIERLMTHLCQKSSVPILAISQFDEVESLREVLPLEFMSRHGALPFAQVGGDLLVAVLNPMDHQLLQRAEDQCGRRCHPYLVTPQEYDARLMQIRKALTTAA